MSAGDFLDWMRCLGVVVAVLLVFWIAEKLA